MRTIFFILQKEFIQIFRNRTMLPFIFVLPLVQLLVLVHAATFEIKNTRMVTVDNDRSIASRDLVAKFEGSGFFKVAARETSVEKAESLVLENRADLILVIPCGFEAGLIHENHKDLQLLVNAINATSAGINLAYAQGIIASFNQGFLEANLNLVNTTALIKSIDIRYRYWYNPYLNYKTFMLPGILVILVTIIGMFLTAMNLVREREMGTIEQINVTPIRKYQFITGKLLPFWIIATFELAFGLLLGKLLFDIPVLGSLWLLFAFASLYLLTVLGLGLFLSSISQSQQQVMFVAFFFLICFLMMSGIFTPAESMPNWAQQVNLINPLYYFMKVIRMILLKGSGFQDLQTEFLSMAIFSVAALTLAIRSYRKRV